jgi:hypothetical protein
MRNGHSLQLPPAAIYAPVRNYEKYVKTYSYSAYYKCFLS